MAQKILKLKRDEAHTFRIEKIVVRIGDHWIDAKWDTIKKQTIETLIDEKMRLMIGCELNNTPFYIITHDIDMPMLRQKYPNCRIIKLNQIAGFLRGLPKKLDGWAVVPEFLAQFNGEVIAYGKDQKNKTGNS